MEEIALQFSGLPDKVINSRQNAHQPGVDHEDIPREMLIIRDLYLLVERRYKKERSPLYYGKQLGVHLKRLNQLSLEYMGYTIYEYVQQRVHNEAIHLLKHTILTSKQISYELGICDPGYFCRCFKKLTGVNPKGFRENHLLSTVSAA